MSQPVGPTASPRAQRRRAEIFDAASTHFAQHGYHRVGIDDVAASVGITGGAIYKHFRGKQDLLARTIDGALLPVEGAIAGTADLSDAIGELAALAPHHRHVGILLTREVRLLEGDATAVVRERIDRVRGVLAGMVAARRPELDPTDAGLLGDAVLSLLSSPAHHTTVLPEGEASRLLTALAEQVADVALPAPDAARPAAPTQARQTATLVDRRDQLIDAAIELFGRRGYWSATMDDLGAAAAIAGPSIYQHLTGKADLLVAGLTRGNEALRLDMSRAFAEGRDPGDTLRLLVESYVDLVLGHPDLIRLLMSESLDLPELERASVRGMQHRYVGEWVHLVQTAHPGLDQPTARFTTHAVLSVVNNRGRPRAHDGRTHDVLVAVAHDLLLTPRWLNTTRSP